MSSFSLRRDLKNSSLSSALLDERLRTTQLFDTWETPGKMPPSGQGPRRALVVIGACSDLDNRSILRNTQPRG